ncbi:tetratricopeptide repeat protein [Pusillimonas sp. ANT_WB101]|uniref:tetratricopeptide repeat protein n=1 Tax=Pusillimonas sp. ANT_WB101 TaxID=2597356 RepID=UPI0011EFF9F7|nr:tetratricopeptide repeat protein [Pusillimonas sp. ANT_WB101]KAA0890124.1 tetratricopeptide repeat protein [Pusillimonas sp. ANT_WB101]
MKFSNPLLYAVCLSAVFHWPAAAQPTSDDKLEQVEQIRLHAGELPSVTLTPDLLYRLLAAELAASQGQYDLAGQTLLDLAIETSDPRLAKRAFQFAMIDRNLARALAAARQWALLAPKDPEAVASSLALAASSGQTAGLANALWQRIDKAEDKDRAVAQASAIIGKMPDKRLALEVLEKALHPSVMGMPSAHLALSDAAWAASDPDRALKEARKAQELDPDSGLAAQRILEYGLQADPELALKETREFVQTHPDSRDVQLLFVNRLVERREFDEALRQVAIMRRNAPEDFDLLYTEAEVNIRAAHYDQARKLLEEYIAVQNQRRLSIRDKASNAMSDASDARLLLVQIAERQNNLKEAIAQLELIDDPSLRFQAQVHKAVLQARMGSLDEARRSLDRLHPRDTHERSVLALTLASIYREAGRTDTAVEVLVKADKEIPDSTEIKYDLAMLYERQGRMEDFETLMRRVIELDPNNANAYNSLGYTYADQNRKLDEAQDLLERALDLDPDNPFILDSVGWYFYRTGDYEAAIEYLKRSLSQMDSIEVVAHLGEVLWVSGRRDEAMKVWSKAASTASDNEVLQETLKRLGVKLK